MNELWIQIVAGVITLGGTIFGTVKYISNQSAKREEALLQHTQTTQQLMLEYFEKKNGHMERMADKFTASNNELSKAVNNLTTKIEVLSVTKQ